MSRFWKGRRGVALSTLARVATFGALLAVASAPGWSLTAPDASPGDDPAQTLLELSGVHHQLGQMGDSVERQLDLQAGALPERVNARMRAAVRAAYDPAWLRETTHAHVRRNLDPVSLPGVIEWLQSDFGRAITRLELEGSSPSASDALPAFVAALQATPPSRARLDRIRRLDELCGATDLATEVSMKVALATARSLTASLEHPPSRDELAAVLEARRQEMRAAVEQTMRVSMLFTYRSLSDRELDAYLEFMASPPGRWYNRVLGAAFLDTLSQAADRFGSHMVGALDATQQPVASPE